MSNIAGCVLAFNRPAYLQRVVDSIEKNRDYTDIDWYGFVDGLYNQKTDTNALGTEDAISKSVEVLRASNIDFKSITVNEFNNGIALQKDLAHKLYESYENIMFFEDDLVLGEDYINLLRLAVRDFPSHMILMNRHPEPKKKQYNVLKECKIARAWGYIMNYKLYNEIKDTWNIYTSFMNGIDYRKRVSVTHEIIDKLPQDTNISHDVTITNLVRESGNKKLWPVVSRGVYIGEKGNYAYYLPHFWKKRGMDNQNNIITYKKDRELKNFRLK